jgi:PEP-CTERM motif
VKTSYVLIALVVLVALPSSSRGAAIIVATEDGGGVTLTGYGSLNLAALSFVESAFAISTGFQGTPPVVEVGSVPTSPLTRNDLYAGSSLIAPPSIGTSTTFVPTNAGNGDFFGATYLLRFSTKPPAIVVPYRYISGTNLTGTSFFPGESFSTLGITPGAYKWTWGTGGDTESLTFQSVPEPSSGLLCLAGIGAISLLGYRRDR